MQMTNFIENERTTQCMSITLVLTKRKRVVGLPSGPFLCPTGKQEVLFSLPFRSNETIIFRNHVNLIFWLQYFSSRQ